MTMNLNTDRLILSEVSMNDAAQIHHMNCIPEVNRYNTIGVPNSFEETRQMVEIWLNQQGEKDRQNYVFAVINQSLNRYMGLASIMLGSPKYKDAEIWYKFEPEYWGKGFGTEAAKALLKFGFEELKLHRIAAGCATGNKASMHIMEKLGMTLEAKTRQSLPIGGEWLDGFDYAILEDEYRGQLLTNGKQKKTS